MKTTLFQEQKPLFLPHRRLGKNFVFFVCLLMLSTVSLAQDPAKGKDSTQKMPVDTLIKKLDSLDRKSDSIGFQPVNIQKEAYNETTRLNARDYFVLLGSNVKQQFTKPFHMTKRDWGNLGKFALVAITVAAADKPIQKNALKLRKESKFVRTTGRWISQSGGVNEVFTLAAFELYGIIANSTKVKTTTLLATQAVFSAALVETVAKTLSGRTRPSYYSESVEAQPKFRGPFGGMGSQTNSSFPSGHATIAFAAATVFAVEYRNKPLIPIVAYSMASLVSISRITENKHWASDILVGAALGYITGRQVSFNYHRYAKIKNDQKSKRAQLRFNLQLTDWGAIQPGFAIKF